MRTLQLNEDALILADRYVKQNVIPAKVTPDAQHIAIASVSHMEVLVSWNLKHIVNLHTKLKVKEINSQLGYYGSRDSLDSLVCTAIFHLIIF